MKLSENGLKEIKSSEAFRAKPYQDIVGVWTIGYGSTYYPDGTKVTKTDAPITEPQASELLLHVFNQDFAPNIPEGLNQNQYDALASFIYNVGKAGFNKSTLKKKVLANSNDVTIKAEFLKWNKVTKEGKKVVSKGLTNRRKREAKLYFTTVEPSKEGHK
ncbi:lysozyme [Emticicia sp. C21]|uniref:lysozyme n=1 Tax=Emticicia sp. C21 TaxID=2302915 RepID=UPI000E349985|nr:lysozyme [Emticicia sp. C21]RFS16993.1 lysozyme [Emticicia sp. C21]